MNNVIISLIGFLLFSILVIVILISIIVKKSKDYKNLLEKKNELQESLYRLRDELNVRREASEESKEKLAQVATGGINAALAILREQHGGEGTGN